MKNLFGLIISKSFTLLLVAAITLMGVAVAKNYLQKQRVNKEVSTLKNEIARLERGNRELGSLIDYLQTSDFLEAQARNKFGLAKDGESVVVISGEPALRSGGPTEQPESVDPINPLKWFNYFWR